MNSVFSVSFFAVLKLLLGVLVGCILGKTGIMPADARRSLSKIILWVMLPCMLITSLCKNISIDNVRQYTWVTLSAGVIALVGFLFAQLLSRLFNVKDEQFRPCVAASCLGNASYIPLPLLGTICLTAPLFSEHANIYKDLSVLYVSVFLMLHSPLLWLFGFPYLSGKSIREIKLKQLLSPPICASFIGWTIGLTPLRRLFVGTGAPLGVIIDTMKLLADAVFPCALLVMGGILADPPPKNEQIRWNTVTSMVITKLLLLPAFGILLVTFLWKYSLIPHDGICALVLMVEASVPPANNLIIMSQSLNKGESSMARLLIWAYMLAVPSLTIWIFFYLTLIQSWMK